MVLLYLFWQYRAYFSVRYCLIFSYIRGYFVYCPFLRGQFRFCFLLGPVLCMIGGAALFSSSRFLPQDKKGYQAKRKVSVCPASNAAAPPSVTTRVTPA